MQRTVYAEIIYIISGLLKQRYGTPGLQNSLLGPTGVFEVIGGWKEFVQVLPCNNDHWLKISTIDFYPVIKVYDSRNTAIIFSTKQQICSILVSSEHVISVEFVAVDRQNNSDDCGLQSSRSVRFLCQVSVEFVAVDRQNNSDDCGLFALAFATALCVGEDSQYLHFNTEGTSMRVHLLQCSENGVIQPFPSEMLKRRRARRDMKNGKIEVFCTCQRAEDEDMSECVKCGEMFHRTCIKESNRIGMKTVA